MKNKLKYSCKVWFLGLNFSQKYLYKIEYFAVQHKFCSQMNALEIILL